MRAPKLVPGALVSLVLIVGSCTMLTGDAPARELSRTLEPLQVLENLRRELIPAEDSATGYGPRFNAAGYEALRQWNVSIQPTAPWADDYARLDIHLPCCDAAHPYEDETKNCGCGHHQAVYGLSKRLLSTGAGPADVQREIDHWRAFMFPREVLQAELQRRALADPVLRHALDELRQQGIC